MPQEGKAPKHSFLLGENANDLCPYGPALSGNWQGNRTDAHSVSSRKLPPEIIVIVQADKDSFLMLRLQVAMDDAYELSTPSRVSALGSFEGSSQWFPYPEWVVRPALEISLPTPFIVLGVGQAGRVIDFLAEGVQEDERVLLIVDDVAG